MKTSVSLSAIDEERFGIRTARAPLVTTDTLPEIMNFCNAESVVFLIARCLSSDLRAAQEMERQGFFLTDTLLYYKRNLVKIPIPTDTGKMLVRAFGPDDKESVKIIAAESFRGYFGHYHADERLDRAKCDETYISWAVRSCVSKEMADEILVADDNGIVVGFATLRRNSSEEGEGVLFGVSPAAQGKGVYRSFMIRSMEWGLSQGFRLMSYSTQITNIAVQKVWVRVGAELSHSYYTFHKWFDTPADRL